MLNPFKLLLATSAATATLAWGCAEPGGDGLGPAQVALGDEACEGQAPPCLSGCTEAEPVADAVCWAGRWRCEVGVHPDVCCDPDDNPDTCPVWSSSCGADTACPSGYTCVKSRSHPTPASSGICRFGELGVPDSLASCMPEGTAEPDVLRWMDVAPAKVEGLLVIDYKCDARVCTAAEPCCQQCMGTYKLRMGTDANGAALVLPILTESIACAGTNCGVSCSPMQPGRRYRIWGTYSPSETAGALGTLYYMGHCPI